MERVVDELASVVAALFESENYQNWRREIDEEFQDRDEKEIGAFADRGREENVALLSAPASGWSNWTSTARSRA
jgi:hypothetical protein